MVLFLLLETSAIGTITFALIGARWFSSSLWINSFLTRFTQFTQLSLPPYRCS